jgi:hypothetical protein
MQKTGKFVCNNPECNEENKWQYIEANHIDSPRYDVHRIDREVVQPYRTKKTEDGILLYFRCKHCDQKNKVLLK